MSGSPPDAQVLAQLGYRPTSQVIPAIVAEESLDGTCPLWRLVHRRAELSHAPCRRGLRSRDIRPAARRAGGQNSSKRTDDPIICSSSKARCLSLESTGAT